MDGGNKPHDARVEAGGQAGEINLRLHQLIALWIDGTPLSMRQIPLLCREIAVFASDSECQGLNRTLLDRVACLSAKGEARFAAFVGMLSRTGSYSTRGAPELSQRIVTTGWEG